MGHGHGADTNKLPEQRTTDSLKLDSVSRHRQGHYLRIHYSAQNSGSKGNWQLLLNGRDITGKSAAERVLQRRDALLRATAEHRAQALNPGH